MKWWAYVLIALLVLFFIPFPIIIKFSYKNMNFEIYLYKKRLNIKKRLKTIKKKESKPHKKPNIQLSDVIKILHKLDYSKFKPTLRTTMKIRYGLYDSAITAVFSGILYSISPVLYRFFTVLFKVKEYDFKILPEFNEALLEAEVDCIIFINIAKIINMAVFAIKSYKFIKKNKQSCKQSEINL